MKQTKIAELKANLSAYLSEVRNGETLVVCDRSTPIARIVPYKVEKIEDDLVIEPALVGAGAPGSINLLKLLKPVKLLKKIDIDRVLSETRADR
jgi:prevent-host-death family protein